MSKSTLVPSGTTNLPEPDLFAAEMAQDSKRAILRLGSLTSR